jgi:hypothetical protein
LVLRLAHPLAPEGDLRTGLLPGGCQSVLLLFFYIEIRKEVGDSLDDQVSVIFNFFVRKPDDG